MDADESFFTRWSRRKRDASGARGETPKPAEPPPPAPVAVAPPTQAAPAEPGSPPLDALGTEDELRRFLAPDVPPALAQAALRQAWSADPAIRDFIGLSENSWDFTAPEGVPGFGALAPEDARRLLAQAAAPEPGLAEPAREERVSATESDAAASPEASLSAPSPAGEDAGAAQDEGKGDPVHPPPRRRHRHGGALPE
jgi:hypothetical protein